MCDTNCNPNVPFPTTQDFFTVDGRLFNSEIQETTSGIFGQFLALTRSCTMLHADVLMEAFIVMHNEFLDKKQLDEGKEPRYMGLTDLQNAAFVVNGGPAQAPQPAQPLNAANIDGMVPNNVGQGYFDLENPLHNQHHNIDIPINGNAPAGKCVKNLLFDPNL